MENQFCCRVDRSSLGKYHQINFTIFHLWLYLLVMLVALSRLATTSILDYFHMLYVLRDSILHLDTCHYQWRIHTGFHSFCGNPLLADLKQERFIDWLLLTLGACARVTVVVLCVSVCVCVCVCVCLLPR